MKRLLTLIMLVAALPAMGHDVFSSDVRSLAVTVDGEWMQMPVMTLNDGQTLYVEFDQLSHDYHRYVYKVEHCEADWTTSEGLFESDWLEGFSQIEIEDYEQSLNTNELYTHYSFSLPNSRCRLKMSGNYRLIIFDDDNRDLPVAEVRFYMVENAMTLALGVTTNTDISLNNRYQQLTMRLDYGSINVTFPDEQIQTVVMQNGGNRWADTRLNVKPNLVNTKGLTWQHNRNLIFEGGNEYRKYEVLALDHTTMGIDRMTWDGHRYHAWPYVDEPRPHYTYDEDANGAFLIRNSDNYESERLCDYVWVHYQLLSPERPEPIYICGDWTIGDDASEYQMEWDAVEECYKAALLQKQGYYSYRYITLDEKSGQPRPLESEGSFFETENCYQAFAYYKGPTDRTWRLVAHATTVSGN